MNTFTLDNITSANISLALASIFLAFFPILPRAS
jgi:hypothetical protein